MDKNWRYWLDQQRATSTMKTTEVPLFRQASQHAGDRTDAFLSIVKGWGFRQPEGEMEANYGREDGAFFSLIGVNVETRAREVRQWSQPMLKEVGTGVVGLIFASRGPGDSLFLLKAREEPGNPAQHAHILLGLPLQASKSNLEAAHGGKTPPRAEFYNRAQSKALQPQDGGRYFEKVVEVCGIEIPYEELEGLTLLADERIFTREELREALREGQCNPHLVEAVAYYFI